jgi:aminoglycoside/choline kinase family phosphotransferase
MFQNNIKTQFDWAHNYLVAHGYPIHEEARPVREMPWSQVYVFKTAQGCVYLKSMAAKFANEPVLLEFLNEYISPNVPEVLASNPKERCFLMKDKGHPLRGILKNEYKIDIIFQALEIYTDIQISSISQVEKLLSLGVSDWRLKNMAHLYQNFIDKEALLLADGLKPFEISKLKRLTKKVELLSQILLSYGIPETLEHGDFHDNNILIQEGCVFINDWGDASITHPFFSCEAFLNSAKRNHGLEEHCKYYDAIQKHYLHKWLAYGREHHLLKTFELAKILQHFVFALSFARIKSCEGITQFPQYNGYITNALRDFIKTMNMVE